MELRDVPTDEEIEENCVIKGTQGRSYLGPEDSELPTDEEIEELAATIVQSSIRGLLARRQLAEERGKAIEVEARAEVLLGELEAATRGVEDLVRSARREDLVGSTSAGPLSPHTTQHAALHTPSPAQYMPSPTGSYSNLGYMPSPAGSSPDLAAQIKVHAAAGAGTPGTPAWLTEAAQAIDETPRRTRSAWDKSTEDLSTEDLLVAEAAVEKNLLTQSWPSPALSKIASAAEVKRASKVTAERPAAIEPPETPPATPSAHEISQISMGDLKASPQFKAMLRDLQASPDYTPETEAALTPVHVEQLVLLQSALEEERLRVQSQNLEVQRLESELEQAKMAMDAAARAAAVVQCAIRLSEMWTATKQRGAALAATCAEGIAKAAAVVAELAVVIAQWGKNQASLIGAAVAMFAQLAASQAMALAVASRDTLARLAATAAENSVAAAISLAEWSTTVGWPALATLAVKASHATAQAAVTATQALAEMASAAREKMAALAVVTVAASAMAAEVAVAAAVRARDVVGKLASLTAIKLAEAGAATGAASVQLLVQSSAWLSALNEARKAAGELTVKAALAVAHHTAFIVKAIGMGVVVVVGGTGFAVFKAAQMTANGVVFVAKGTAGAFVSCAQGTSKATMECVQGTTNAAGTCARTTTDGVLACGRITAHVAKETGNVGTEVCKGLAALPGATAQCLEPVLHPCIVGLRRCLLPPGQQPYEPSPQRGGYTPAGGHMPPPARTPSDTLSLRQRSGGGTGRR